MHNIGQVVPMCTPSNSAFLGPQKSALKLILYQFDCFAGLTDVPNTYTDHAPTSEAIGYVNAIHVMSPNNTAIELVTHSLSNFSVQKSCDIRIKTFQHNSTHKATASAKQYLRQLHMM